MVRGHFEIQEFVRSGELLNVKNPIKYGRASPFGYLWADTPYRDAIFPRTSKIEFDKQSLAGAERARSHVAPSPRPTVGTQGDNPEVRVRDAATHRAEANSSNIIRKIGGSKILPAEGL